MTLPMISDSTFNVLRGLVALIHADQVVSDKERVFLKTLINYFEQQVLVPDFKKEQLRYELEHPQAIETILPLVTERKDRENLIIFAGMLAMADGENHPAEEAVMKKIREHCGAAIAGSFQAAAAPNPQAPSGPSPSSPSPSGTAQLPDIIPPAVPAPVGNNNNNNDADTPDISVDLEKFGAEVREIVKQEFYRQALDNTGIGRGTSAVGLVDAFVERGSLIDQKPDLYRNALPPQDFSPALRRSLMPNEIILGRVRFHEIYLFKSMFYGFLLAATIRLTVPLIFKAMYNAHQFLPAAVFTSPLWSFALYWLGPLIGILFFLHAFLTRFLTEAIVTDRRFLFKKGIIFVTFVKIDLRQLFETVVTQSRLGAILDYGQVFVYLTMMDTNVADNKTDRNLLLPPDIADPHGFSSLIERAKRKLRARGDG